MQSFRNLVAVNSAILVLAVLAPTASHAAAAPVFTPFTVDKECSEFTGGLPSFCTIIRSSIRDLRRTKVFYYGPELGANGQFVSSTVILDASTGPRNSTALGHCIVYATAPTGPAGMCSFNGGTGSLEGFQAIVKVTVDANMIWHWVGVQTNTADD